MRTKGSASELEARRRRAAKLFRERKPLAEIARHVGASLSSVKRWKRAWKEGGIAALVAKPHPGPTPKLSLDQKQKLVVLLKAGPTAAGFKTDLWTCARVAKVVRKNFRVSYHPDHLGRILYDLGYSPQKPQRVARLPDAQQEKICEVVDQLSSSMDASYEDQNRRVPRIRNLNRALVSFLRMNRLLTNRELDSLTSGGL
jgi:transposase